MRDLARYKDMRVHSEIIVSSGKVGKLKEKFDHYSYWDYFQIMKKYDMYTTWAAEDLRDKGVKTTVFRTSLSLRPGDSSATISCSVDSLTGNRDLLFPDCLCTTYFLNMLNCGK